METKLTSKARQSFVNFLDKWDFENAENPYYGEAIRREADQDISRVWYKKISTWTLKEINTTHARQEPRRPDSQVEHIVLEPPDVEDFLVVPVTKIQAATAT